MSIRYHLLLIAGITTTLVFLASFFLESVLLNRSLESASQASSELYHKMYVKRQEYLQEFVREALISKLAQINAFLNTIAQYQPLGTWFAPSQEHVKQGTWSNAANFLQQDAWISFLQNTVDKQVLSLLIPEKGPFARVHFIPIQEGMVWVYHQEDALFWIGVEVPTRPILEQEGQSSETLGVLPAVYALYRVDTLQHMSLSQEADRPYIPIPYTQSVEVDDETFLMTLRKAVQFVQGGTFQVPVFMPTLPNSKHVTLSSFQEEVYASMEKLFSYERELFVIWQAAVLQEIGAFHVWPEAMSFSIEADGNAWGEAFFLHDVMQSKEPRFDDVAFYDAHPPLSGSLVSSGSYLLQGKAGKQAFLLNTAALFTEEETGKKERSLLSIGMDISDILSDLTAMTHSFGCIISQGHVVINQAPDGRQELPVEIIEALLPFSSQEGDITIDDNVYHFFRMQPDPHLDMQVVLFHPKQDVFDFSYNFQLFQSEMGHLVEQLDLERRALEGVGIFVLWLLLLRLSKRITRPIITLAKALPLVKKGAWDQMQTLSVPSQKHNEISMLYDAFHDMVQGMKEKEKVTGILNKVVSPEVAREILQGDIALGGEDRVVSMLFVDIRGFTKLTQNMPPHEVISLLNTCMTKLAARVEQHKGVIDKFLGDGLMAIYGAPLAQAAHAKEAIASGLSMISDIREWNIERQQQGLPPIEIGIGVHTGSVCVGNMGAQDRLNYTVIGSHVNLAARLCAAAPAETLFVTEDTLQEPEVATRFIAEDHGLMTFKGFDEQKHVFSVTAK